MYFGFEDIKINYGTKNIVNNVDMTFEKGKVYSIIGKNGCGKTSLLKLVSRVVKQNNGQVILEGKPLSNYSSKEIAKKVAYVSQYHEALSDIDVKTLISFGRYPHTKFGRGLTKQDNDIVDDIINLTNLTHLKDQQVQTLSGGERQRAWLAMALAQQPQILILDEPTTYLDIHFQIELLDLIKELNKTLNLTIVMVLHDLNLAARYSDYLYAIKDKCVYKQGNVLEMITKENIEDIFHLDSKIIHDEFGVPFFIPLSVKGI